MKRIDLFQLMNAFQDEEFEPEEECFVDRNKVKETVLAQVRQKKRKGRTVLVLAAALAACLALAGWSCGEQIYQFFSGGWVSIGGADDGPTMAMSNGLDENGEPTIISLENGRLWFVADGQRVDVTSQVNENTPYVWTQWEKNGGLHYIIVGGTPEDYGWFEGIELPGDSGGGSGMFHSREDIPWAGLVQSRPEPGRGTVGVAKRIKHGRGQGAGDRALFLYTGGPVCCPYGSTKTYLNS